MASRPSAYLHFGEFDAYGKLDFDKQEIRRAMRAAGVLIRRSARDLVNRHEVSAAGENPGFRTGVLRRSIKFKVSRSGFLVRISPQKIAGMKQFYPAYLHYGVRNGRAIKSLAPGKGKGRKNRRAAGVRARLEAERKLEAWRIEPRKNFMEEALSQNSDRIQQMLREAFRTSLR